jgi:hypothetical protein
MPRGSIDYDVKKFVDTISSDDKFPEVKILFYFINTNVYIETPMYIHQENYIIKIFNH